MHILFPVTAKHTSKPELEWRAKVLFHYNVVQLPLCIV